MDLDKKMECNIQLDFIQNPIISKRPAPLDDHLQEAGPSILLLLLFEG